ncbi:hypothetical protein FACS189467_0340 [Bacteroidia bacterium]|nr:hypothetical protein FACS189467_0340 [Bacteroidia bacterium]
MACADIKTPISTNELSVEIKGYVSTHFPEQKIIQAIQERDNLRTSFEVLLDNHIEVTFNKNGQVREVESKVRGQALPNSVIPAPILTYVQDKFPVAVITTWELDGRRQKVELSTDLDLEFDLRGNFLRIDD